MFGTFSALLLKIRSPDDKKTDFSPEEKIFAYQIGIFGYKYYLMVYQLRHYYKTPVYIYLCGYPEMFDAAPVSA